MQNVSYLLEPAEPTSIWSSLQEEFLESYCKDFYWSSPGFLSSEQVHEIIRRGRELEASQLLEPASIGKGAIKQQREEIRKDRIHWIDDFSSLTGQIISEVFAGLTDLARSKLYLPAKRFECHYAKFNKDDFYKRHSDRHKTHPSRLLTCVIYLSDLEARGGGELVLYDEELRPVTITPEPGRIVIFDSSIEHEVRPCRSERWSITGWIRSDLHPSMRFF